MGPVLSTDTAEPAFLVDRNEGVLTLTFNRPEAGNAMPPDAVAGLIELFAGLNDDDAVGAVLVRGRGRNFSAGGDVRVFAQSLEQPHEVRRIDWQTRQQRLIDLVTAYVKIEAPVVADCQGGVIGAGLMYALGADYVVADDTVLFAFAQQRLGLTPDGGVTALLSRAVGERRAAALVLTAARVRAEEAFRIGLVHELAPADGRESRALEVARRLAASPRRVIRRAKRMMMPLDDLASKLAAERDAIVDSVCEGDFEEGVRAFLEKREPTFGGES